jgi:hypothetical protein
LIYTISGNPNTRQKFIKGSAIVEESMSLWVLKSKLVVILKRLK